MSQVDQATLDSHTLLPQHIAWGKGETKNRLQAFGWGDRSWDEGAGTMGLEPRPNYHHILLVITVLVLMIIPTFYLPLLKMVMFLKINLRYLPQCA